MQGGNSQSLAWTKNEIEFLKQNYPLYGGKYVAEHIGRSVHAVRMKAMALDIRSRAIKPWSEEEINFFKKYYPSRGGAYVAKKLGRTHKSVIAQAIRMNIRRNNFRRWEEWEVRYIKRHYGSKSSRSIGRTLGRSDNAVLTKAKKLGLVKQSAALWTETEKKLLLELYPNPSIPLSEIAKRIGRPIKGVIKQGRKLKLSRNFFWTKKEHDFVAKNYKTMEYAEMARHLGKTTRAVTHYANRHGFRRRPTSKKWSAEETQFLIDNIGAKSAKEIATQLKRSIHSVRARLQLVKKKQQALNSVSFE